MSHFESQHSFASLHSSQGSIRTALLACCVLLCPSLTMTLRGQVEPSSKQTTTFLVVRHAERAGNLDQLTPEGEQRSQVLAAIGSALRVQAIYSTNTKRTKGTAQPLATLAGSEIEIYGRLSKAWLESLKERHAGQCVLVVGHSNTAGVIAGLLAGEKPFTIDHDEYDSLFVVQISGEKTQCLRLRYGATTNGSASADPDKMGKLGADKGGH